MITAHQPTCFPDDLVVRVSSRADGSMLRRSQGVNTGDTIINRQAFCQASGLDYQACVFQWIHYEAAATYDCITEVDRRFRTNTNPHVMADAVITKMPNVGIFLPIADCIGLVLYDPINKILAMLHMGRHSTITDIISRTIDRLKLDGTNPENLIAWMSPSISQDSYRLDYFHQANYEKWRGFVEHRENGFYIDMQGYNQARLLDAGLLAENIFISPIDTARSQEYFSHSHGDIHERFAVVAMMHE